MKKVFLKKEKDYMGDKNIVYEEQHIKELFEKKQEELQSKIELNNMVTIDTLHNVAGVDLAYWKNKDKEYACCCIVVYDYKTLEVIEKKSSVGEVTVPYIAGCLAFREYELFEKTAQLLENNVDLYMFDGNGYLHPRHMGLATYAGIMLGKPTIGVAKSSYKFIDFDYSNLKPEEGNYIDIVIGGEVYGRVLRTHTGVKPIFVSVGNMIDLEVATKIVMNMIGEESHIPITTRYADIMTHEVRKNRLSNEK